MAKYFRFIRADFQDVRRRLNLKHRITHQYILRRGDVRLFLLDIRLKIGAFMFRRRLDYRFAVITIRGKFRILRYNLNPQTLKYRFKQRMYIFREAKRIRREYDV